MLLPPWRERQKNKRLRRMLNILWDFWFKGDIVCDSTFNYLLPINKSLVCDILAKYGVEMADLGLVATSSSPYLLHFHYFSSEPPIVGRTKNQLREVENTWEHD